MKAKEFSAIVVKLAGIVCLIRVLWSLAYLISIFQRYLQLDDPKEVAAAKGALLSGACTFLIFVFAGLFLIFAGDRIGRFIIRSDAELPLVESGGTVFRLGVALIGIWVMAEALPNLISMGSKFFLTDYVIQGKYPGAFVPELIGELAKMVVGGGLLLGCRGVVGFYKFLRKAGE